MSLKENTINWIQNLDNGTWEIRDALIAIFNYFLVNNKALENTANTDNAYNIVYFVWNCSSDINIKWPTPTLEPKSLRYNLCSLCLSQLNSIAIHLEKIASKTNTIKCNEKAYNVRKWYIDTRKELEKDPDDFKFTNVYKLIIIDNWEYLKTFPITYEFLFTMIVLQVNWPDTVEKKDELINLLKNFDK